MRVNSTVNLNFRTIRRLTEEAVSALEMTGEAVHTEEEQAQVMPFDTGALQGEGTFTDYGDSEHGKVSIVSSTPYARRLYYHPEYKFNKGENPNAKGKWHEDWMKGGKNESFAQEKYAENLRRLGDL